MSNRKTSVPAGDLAPPSFIAIDFFVPGVPAPGGSKKAFVVPRKGQPGKFRAVVVDDAKRNAPWRDSVATYAAQAMQGRPPTPETLCVAATFFMPRPGAHFGTGRNKHVLKPGAPAFHSVKPDVTKLWRAAEDAMTGIVWMDDSRIVRQVVEKRYGEKPGLHLLVKPWPPLF